MLRKAASWSPLATRYCVRFEMRFDICLENCEYKIISVCWDGSGGCVNILNTVTPLMSRRATNLSSSSWSPVCTQGSSLFAQKIECYLIVLKVFCIIVKPRHDTGPATGEDSWVPGLATLGLSWFYCQSRHVSSWFNPISRFEIKHVLDLIHWISWLRCLRQGRRGLLLSGCYIDSVQIEMRWGGGDRICFTFLDLYRSLNLVQKYLNYSSNC